MARELLLRTVINNPFIPKMPTEPQAVFLTAPDLEIMYGGAGFGGKSVAMLMAALQYATVPGYHALLLRRTFPDLWMPDGLIPMSHEWLRGTEAVWSAQKNQWTFPTLRPNGAPGEPATLNFSYLQTDADRFKYKGPSFQFIGFDELTGFSEIQYRFLFQRLRRLEGVKIPIRMRSASNPGDRGHEWVKKRFIDTETEDRLFIPAAVEDNPYADVEEYDRALAELDPVTRRQFRHGDWRIRPEGNLFKRAWFAGLLIDAAPPIVARVRFWDLAATAEDENNSSGGDPDASAGVRIGETAAGQFVIEDVVKLRGTPHEVEKMVAATARRDGYECPIAMEQEPGSSGKTVVDQYRRGVLKGYQFRGITTTGKGDKTVRAGPFSSACEARNVSIVSGPWVDEFLDELCAFPVVAHDDQADAAFGAFNYLTREPREWGQTEIDAVFNNGGVARKKKSPAELIREKLKNRGRNR